MARTRSTTGLHLLDAQTRVVLTGTPYHQDSLVWYTPPDGGPPSQVVVELVPALLWSGDQAGWWGIEVRIDGYRVGELTHPEAGWYWPTVDRMLRAGRRPGAEAHVVIGETGLLEVELYLPVAGAPAAEAPYPGSATDAAGPARRAAVDGGRRGRPGRGDDRERGRRPDQPVRAGHRLPGGRHRAVAGRGDPLEPAVGRSGPTGPRARRDLQCRSGRRWRPCSRSPGPPSGGCRSWRNRSRSRSSPRRSHRNRSRARCSSRWWCPSPRSPRRPPRPSPTSRSRTSPSPRSPSRRSPKPEKPKPDEPEKPDPSRTSPSRSPRSPGPTSRPGPARRTADSSSGED